MKNTEERVSSNDILQGEFEPIKYDKLFFIKNHVFLEDDFEDNSMFSKNAARISTKDFVLNISKKQINIIFKSNNIDQSKVSKIVESINKENRIEIFFNQKWFKTIDDISEITRSHFYPTNSDFLNEYFNAEDSAFGLLCK